MNLHETTPYEQVDADAHQTTLNLLEEVADYLSRLPAHPMTHAMLQRVKSHLTDPSAKAQKKRLAMLATDQVLSAKIKSGDGFKGVSQFTPSGLPVVTVRLLYPALLLESPAVQWHLNAGNQVEAERLSAEIGRELAGGVSIQVQPIHPIFDSGWLDPKSVTE